MRKQVAALESQLETKVGVEESLLLSRKQAEEQDILIKKLTADLIAAESKAKAKAEALAAQAAGSEELQKAKKVLAEQEERLTQVQQMWYDKERELRAAYANLQRAQQERQFTINQLKAVLKEYHDAEIAAATERLTQMDARIQQFLAAQSDPAKG